MYREFREKRSSRSRSGERKAIGDPDDLVVVERAQREGNVQLRKQTNLSKITLDFAPGDKVPVEENSFDLEFRCASKKACRTPIKALIDKEMSKEMEIRRSSPSLVARLMGLDTLPPVVIRQQKEKGISSQKTSSVGFHGKHTVYEGYPLETKYQDCKDVFEVMEMPKIEKQNNKPFRKRMPSLGQSEIDLKPSDIDLAYAKQFMDAAHLSTYDEFEYSKEYNDALEDLDPNKNLFVKVFPEPNSLFKKHLQDLKCSPPSPHESHITILKPSRVAKSDNELHCRSETNTERHSHSLKGDIRSCRRPVTNLVNHSIKERSCSLPHKLSEPLYAGKTEGHLKSTQIVVLKPSLEKAWDTAKTVPLARSLDNYPYSFRRQKRIPMSRRSEGYRGGMERHKLSDSLEVMGHKAKGLREIARDFTKQLRSAGSSGSKMVTGSKKYGYIRDESSDDMSDMENLKSESHRWIFDQLNECSDSLSASSYYLTESSVSREARKCLSERWKLIQQIQEVGPVNKGSSTLGEMLVSDRKIPRTTINASIIQNVSGEKVPRDEILARWDSPLDISSMDGWKYRWSRNFSRSKSLPASSLIYGNHMPSKRNRVGISDNSYLHNVLNKSRNDSLDRNVSQIRSSIQSLNYHHNISQFRPGREKNEMSEREIHVNSEQLRDRVHVRHPVEEPCMVPELSNNFIAGNGYDGGNLAPQCKDKVPAIVDDQQVQRSTKLEVQAKDGEFSGADPNYVARKESSVDHPQVSALSSHCNRSESPSPVSSKEDQQSPISVLEPPPSEEDKSSSECFEKISADLKELRMQLKLLKLESADTDAEDLKLLVSSDEDIEGECHSPLNPGEKLEEFRDDEDRDFSYLLDVLIDSGVHSTSANGFFNACYRQEHPVGREVFENLEKKYNVLASWSRSERKLLFDLISSILADIITPSIDLQSMKSKRCRPTCAREGLVEELWQLLLKQRYELSGKLEEQLLLDPKWLDLGDDADMVGSELERMLTDDLVEELLSQMI